MSKKTVSVVAFLFTRRVAVYANKRRSATEQFRSRLEKTCFFVSSFLRIFICDDPKLKIVMKSEDGGEKLLKRDTTTAYFFID